MLHRFIDIATNLKLLAAQIDLLPLWTMNEASWGIVQLYKTPGEGESYTYVWSYPVRFVNGFF